MRKISQEDIEALIARIDQDTASESEKEFMIQWRGLNEANENEFHRILAVIRAQKKAITPFDVIKAREGVKTSVIQRLIKKNRSVKKSFYSIISIAVIGSVSLLGGMQYKIAEKDQLLAGSFELNVPAGQTSNCTLPDGTQVWLNSQSVISYRYNTKAATRSVQLNGEAYFKVAKDKKHPFIVAAEDNYVKVFGTEFNMTALENEDLFQVTLVEGQVGIFNNKHEEIVRLKPGEKIRKEDGGRFEMDRNADIEVITSWKEGRYIFKDVELTQITKKLEEMYDIEIFFKDEQLKKERFRCVLEKKRSVVKTLEILKLTSDVTYEIEGTKIYLKRK
ncbi:FecR family protein [Marinilabiliaceae bacterium JC017]|nr:FecR family protein [Marinilabiliaceae bacterium JC017]